MLEVDFDSSSLNVILEGLSDSELRQALEDAGQVIILSTNVGYTRGVDPEGNKWAPNPSWYSDMKGGSAPLTGPTSTSIQGGQWSGSFEFKKINMIRMKNALEKDVGKSSVTVRYMPSVDERAQATQEGGPGTIELVNKKTGNTVQVNVNIQPRKHLGIADKYARLGGKTDIEHIIDIFESMVSAKLL